MAIVNLLAIFLYMLPFIITILLVWWVTSLVNKSYQQKERHFQILTEQNQQIIAALQRPHEEKHL